MDTYTKVSRNLIYSLAHFPLGYYLFFVLLVVAAFLYWAQADLGWTFDLVQLQRWSSANQKTILQVLLVPLALILAGSAIAHRIAVGRVMRDYDLWRHQRATRVLFPAFSPIHDWIRIRSKPYHWWHAQTVSNFTHIVILVLALIGFGKATFSYIGSAQASHGCSDAVTITVNTTWSTNQCHGDVVVRNNATLTINGGITADLSSLSVGSDAPAENGFVVAKGDTLNNLGVTLNVDGTVYVRASSSISADGQGYIGGRSGDYNGKGPGGGEGRGVSDDYAAGGGYGGNGGNGGTGIDGGTAYGSISSPVDLGSGGGFSTGCCSNNGGDGGGAIKINAPTSTVTIDGTITANGTTGGQGCCALAGSGSGGSIWVVANTLAGSGIVRSNGGGGGGANGAGGRISLQFSSDTSTLTEQAFDGGQSGLSRGGAGTISTPNELIIANSTAVTSIPVAVTPLSGTLTYANTTFKDYVNVTLASGATYAGGTTLIQNNTKTTLLADNTVWSGGALTVQTGTNTINVPKNITTEPEFTAITVGSGTLQHDSHTSTHTYSLILKSTGSATVSGTINIDGKGYVGGRPGDVNGKGPGGAVTDGTNSAGGGGYGGNGGSVGSNSGGSSYGSISSPTDLGSGGGFVTSCCSNNGGDGGGAVKINAPNGTVTVSGTITSNGTTGGQGCCAYAGSGSGGSIWIIANTLTGTGTIRANGGANGSGASGAGGRIQLSFSSDSSALTKQTFDGGQNGAARGAAGTISTSSELTIANSTAVTSIPVAVTPLSGTLTYANTTFKDYVNVTLASGASYAGGTTTLQNNTRTTLLADDTVWSGGALTVQTGTNTINVKPTIAVKPSFSTINFASGNVYHDDHTSSDNYHIILAASGNITVGTSINLTGLGFAGGTADSNGNGPGAGSGLANNHGGGAGHGGNGGTGSSSGGAGGSSYGDNLAPVTLGSGGGGAQGIAGGDGGGSIQLISGGTLAVNSSIISSGGNGGVGCCSYFYGSGGGSGGSIFLAANEISGSAAITANGGNGGNTLGGCGSGGRVSRHYQSLTYSGSATATKGTGSCAAGQDGTNQTVGVVTDLVVSGITTPRTAGTTSSVVVEARDVSNNRNYSYTKTITFTSSDGQADLPGNYAFTTANAGQATISGVVLKTAGTQSVTADQSDDGTVDGSQSNIVVNPGTATTLTVTGATDPVTAGSQTSPVVAAKDAYNNTATGYVGTITLSSTDSQASLPANYTFVGGDAGVKTFTNGVTFESAGEQSLTATDTITGSITGTQSAITVTAGAVNSLVLSGISAATTAGTTHSPVVTAKDAFENIVTTYAGTIAFSSSDSAATLPANFAFTGTENGTKVFPNSLTFKTAGTHSVTVSDGTRSSNANGIAVTAGTPSKLKVSNVTSPTNVGSNNSATVTAQDSFNNTVAGYTGTIRLTSTDLAASLPASYTFTPTDLGIHVFSSNLTFNTAGTQSLTATDTSNSSITGTLAGIVVVAQSTAPPATPPADEPALTIPSLSVIFTVPSTGTFTGTIEQLVNGIMLDVVVTGTVKGNTISGTVSGTYGSEPVSGSISGTLKGKNIDSALVTLVGTVNPQVSLSVILSGVINSPTETVADQPCKLRGTLEMMIDGKKFVGEAQLTVASDGTVTGGAKGFLDDKRVFGRFTATSIQGEIVAGQVTLTETGKDDVTTGEIVGTVDDSEIVLTNAQHCNFAADVDVDTDGDGDSDGTGTGSVVIDQPVVGNDDVSGGVQAVVEDTQLNVDTIMNGTFETLVANIVVKPSGLSMTTVEQNELISGALAVVSGVALLPTLPGLQNLIITSSTRGVSFFQWFFFGYVPRRKRKFWGVIRDKTTQVPVVAALARLFDYRTGTELKNMRTDHTGRYGFLIEGSGEYQVRVSDPLYANYKSNAIIIRNLTEPIITGDIGLDPIAQKHAKFISNTQMYLAIIKFLNFIHWPLLIVGTILSAWLVFEYPTALRILALGLYATLWISKLVGYRRERHYGQVTDSAGNPLPRAVIQLTSSKNDVTSHIQSTVTDKMGRFVLLVKPGAYEIIVAKEGFKIRRGDVIADEVNIVIKLEPEAN